MLKIKPDFKKFTEKEILEMRMFQRQFGL